MLSYADKETELMLHQLEKRIISEYGKAQKEITEKAYRHFVKYHTQMDMKLRAVNAGDMTMAQFREWERQMFLVNERWEVLRETMARRVTDASVVAASYINETTPPVFGLNLNFERCKDFINYPECTFSVFNEDAVRRLIKDNPELLPPKVINITKDIAWNKKRLNSCVTQAILQGMSITELARNFEQVSNMSRSSAIRNARTSVTSAQNGGRYMAATQLRDDYGIEQKKEWQSIEDKRTRDSHRHMNGETVEIDQPFSNNLMYPGDPSGEPEEVYNCRCRLNNVDIKFTKVPTQQKYLDWADEQLSKQAKGKAGVEKEEGRPSGFDRKTEINYNAVNALSYRKKFDSLGESPDITRTIYQESKKMLEHRNGTNYEDLCFVDTISGAIKKRTDYNKPREVLPSEAMKKMVSKADPDTIVAIHNHTASSMPSKGDLMAAYERQYKYGLIACHNGQVIKYKVSEPLDDVIAEVEFTRIKAGLESGNKAAVDKAIKTLKGEGTEIEIL